MMYGHQLLSVLCLLAIADSVASASAHQDWLNGKVSSTPKTGPPLFVQEEWSRLRDECPFKYTFVVRNGVPTPTLNGEALIGVSYRYFTFPYEQGEYDSRILRSAGVNVTRSSMRSVPAEGGEASRVAAWRRKADVFHRRGIAGLLEPGGMNYVKDILADLYPNVLKRPLPEAFVRWRGALPGNRYGDFFNPEYCRAHGQVLRDLMVALGPSSVVGYVYSDEPSLKCAGPQTEAADLDWRQFLARFYQDGTPGRDTNRDGVTFNSFFERDYATWDDVGQFSKEEHASARHVEALVDSWMRYGHARFIDTLSRECQQARPEACVSEAYIGGWEQVSLLNAMPHMHYVGFGNYGRLAKTAGYVAAAHAYDRPGFTFHINKGRSDYHGARLMGVASLPFTTAQIWWHLTVGTSDRAASDWGQYYGLANWWEYNDPHPKHWGTSPNRLVEYDPRFLIIPQIKPFMGRFDSMPREMANGVLWIEPPCDDLVRNNHVVSEEALVLGRRKLDMGRYKLAIFLKRGPAKFAETFAALRDYVRRGGTAVVNANEVGSGTTLFGQPNAQYWLKPYRIGRSKPYLSPARVLYEDRFVNTKRWEQDAISREGPCPLVTPRHRRTVGAFPDGAWGSFVYRFRIPDRFTHFRITDNHIVWGGGTNQVKMWLSSDNENWVLQHSDPWRWGGHTFSRIYSIDESLAGRRDLFVKYHFKAGDPKRHPQDNRGAALSYFRLEALVGRNVQDIAEWQGQYHTIVELADLSFQCPRLEPFVLPGDDMNMVGRVTDEKGASRPLVIVRPEGEGRWLIWNSPESIITVAHNEHGFDANVFRAKWRLLDAVVR